MKKDSFMEELSKRLSQAATSPEANVVDAGHGQNNDPVWREAGTGMNVEQLRIGKIIKHVRCHQGILKGEVSLYH